MSDIIKPETHDKRTETHACDCISRQEAIEALGEEPEVWNGTDEEIAARNQWRADMEAIKAVLSAEPKKGKWIKRDSYDRRDNFYSCSICGRMVNIICGAHLEDYPFCHCGADMRGEAWNSRAEE